MDSLEITLSVPDRARADVLVTNDRIYYRFATPDTLDQGDLPGLKGDTPAMLDRIAKACTADGNLIPPEELKITVKTDDTLLHTISESALREIVGILQEIDEVFLFLRGFA